MKCYRLLTILFLSSAALNLCTQERKGRAFIRGYFQEKEPVFYTETTDAPEYLYKLFVDICNRDTWSTNRYEPRVVLTNEEKDFILAVAAKKIASDIDGNLLKNSTLIPRRELNEFFKDGAYGWSTYTQKYNNGYYSFLKPIFIRNETICLFTLAMLAGSYAEIMRLLFIKKSKEGGLNGSFYTKILADDIIAALDS